MWSVVVEEKGTHRELCRYTCDSKKQAQEVRQNVRAIRVKQNGERVYVRLVQEREGYATN